MRTETYYINELTGEVLTNRQDCRIGEMSYAETLKANILNTYSEIDNYCRGRECEECVFCYDEGYGCVLRWFNGNVVRDEIIKRNGE